MDIAEYLSELKYLVAREVYEVKLFLKEDKPNLFKMPRMPPSVLGYAVESSYSYIREEGMFSCLRRFVCRLYAHDPYGVVWFNASSLEPDMSCNNCGEDLG